MAPRSSPRGVVHGTVDANAEGVAWPTLSSRLSRWADPPAAEDPGPSQKRRIKEWRGEKRYIEEER